MTQTAGQAEWTLGRRTVPVTHLDKLFWPADGMTKGEMLEMVDRFYERFGW